jgi:gluconolactonase
MRPTPARLGFAGVDGAIVAEGLAFPEGPVWTGDGLYVTEVAGGTLTRWTEAGGLEPVATTGGGPNGAVLAADGALYVTQNGGMEPARRVAAGIQRVTPAGDVTMVVTEIAGLHLGAPNDLVFGPDGRLWFTDPRSAPDGSKLNPGRLFALDPSTGEGELVIELEPVYPNGIAFTADGTLLWTESFSRRVMALDDGGPRTVIELPDNHFPDGMCVGADGTLYVASTYAHCVSVVRDGDLVDRLECGDGMATNCCFGGTDLYVTESRHGTLWRFALGVEGLPLATG